VTRKPSIAKGRSCYQENRAGDDGREYRGAREAKLGLDERIVLQYFNSDQEETLRYQPVQCR